MPTHRGNTSNIDPLNGTQHKTIMAGCRKQEMDISGRRLMMDMRHDAPDAAGIMQKEF